MKGAGGRLSPTPFGDALAAGYRVFFGQQWPAWVGGVLFGMLSILLFAWEKPWPRARPRLT